MPASVGNRDLNEDFSRQIKANAATIALSHTIRNGLKRRRVAMTSDLSLAILSDKLAANTARAPNRSGRDERQRWGRSGF
jgi:hypothetical protein